MHSRKLIAFLIILIAIYYSCTSVSEQNTQSAQNPSIDSTFLCDPNSAFYKLAGSLELPLLTDIPNYSNTDSLIAYLQNAADTFSWKTFIALNWPATRSGDPDTTQCFANNSAVSVVWESWMPNTDIFDTETGFPKLWPTGTAAIKPLQNNIEVHQLRISKVDSAFTIFDAEQFPVVDSRHMYTLFENFYNRSAYDYIVKGKLYNKAGQTGFSKTWPNLTTGFYPVKNGHDTLNIAAYFKRAYFSVGNAKDSVETQPDLLHGDSSTYTIYFTKDPGAMIIKSAWVVLVPGKDDTSKYLTRTIWVKNGHETKMRTLGLVGMHIMHKVAEQTQWVWSSFEHIDNAPVIDEKGNAILKQGVDYLYFDEAKNDASLYNKKPSSVFESNPFKRVPTQVVQLKGPQKSTEMINDYFYNLIKKADTNSKWLNYRLIGTQWAFQSDFFTMGSNYQPSILANPILETYIQSTSSCMGCHSQARFLNDSVHYGYNADFVWELANVK